MKNKLILFIVGSLVALASFFMGHLSRQSEQNILHLGAGTTATIQNVSFFSATTTNATSTTAQQSTSLANANKVTFYFQRGDTTGQGNSGSSLFSVQVSRTNSSNDADWITYNKLIDNVTNSNAQQLTRVATSSLTGTTTKIYTMDLSNEALGYVRCIVVETTDGEHTCKGIIEHY